MSDLRRMLDLLYDDHRDEVRQPGLRNLDELLDGTRAAGLPVRRGCKDCSRPACRTRWMSRPTASSRRSSPTPCATAATPLISRIDQDDTHLVITGSNPFPAVAKPSPGTGRGLDGIRHRASLFSGTVETGPAPDALTWTTRVSFPLETDR